MHLKQNSILKLYVAQPYGKNKFEGNDLFKKKNADMKEEGW